ncbi:hypothetical protein EJ06DRAFT_285468 [Trichodelitschia bisporula]|uniref:Uncharacterized protein n=1 Tax=Trichodelitschia bisporula TaxID=703511 RepID=A0A6G1I5R9_9PEZI|nr:hypothetical protein EJ06DRAFT_285468 [Trichodelitschia bisporula]
MFCTSEKQRQVIRPVTFPVDSERSALREKILRSRNLYPTVHGTHSIGRLREWVRLTPDVRVRHGTKARKARLFSWDLGVPSRKYSQVSLVPAQRLNRDFGPLVLWSIVTSPQLAAFSRRAQSGFGFHGREVFASWVAPSGGESRAVSQLKTASCTASWLLLTVVDCSRGVTFIPKECSEDRRRGLIDTPSPAAWDLG